MKETMTTDTPAAALITAERELLQRAWQWMADNETAIFACSESAWKQMTLIAADIRAALSAPVAAPKLTAERALAHVRQDFEANRPQPAASGVDALWLEQATKLELAIGASAFACGNWRTGDEPSYDTLYQRWAAARDALRAHLSTALTGAAKE